MPEENIRALVTQLSDAVSRNGIEEAGQILTSHLGELMVHDAASVSAIVAKIDIRAAVKYPALAVVHPRRNRLSRIFPLNSPLPQFTLRDRRLEWVYVMAFAREAGFIKVARAYARQRSAFAYAPEARPIPLGHEWLVWFQLGLTSFAAGDLQQASGEFRIASEAVTTLHPPHDGLSDATRMTLGYRALVSAHMGMTTAAAHHLARAQSEAGSVGSFLWSLLATARAVVAVEQCAQDASAAVAALDLIDNPEPFWASLLLTQTRHAELNSLPADSLAVIEHAEARYHPEIGSFAYDVLIAQRVSVLVILSQLAAARRTYDEKAIDAPYCQIAHLALLVAEHDFVALTRETEAVLALPTLTGTQRVEAQTLGALGLYVRDGAIPDYIGAGLGFALSQRHHRRIALMFPPFLRDALAPHLNEEVIAAWERSKLNVRLWSQDERTKIPALTPRERSMLKYVDEDLGAQEIATRENLSVNTVKTHLKSLYKKLGASTRADAAASARRWHLLDEHG